MLSKQVGHQVAQAVLLPKLSAAVVLLNEQLENLKTLQRTVSLAQRAFGPYTERRQAQHQTVVPTANPTVQDLLM
jgi:hypothetical protein